jgi:hypothetical protein
MSLLNDQDRCAVAHALYDAGFKPTWSSDVADNLIAGYGDMDKHGEFIYPLYVVNGEVKDWPYVKARLRVEEQLENAQDVFAGFEDLDIHDGDYIKFEGEFYKARYEAPDLFSFISINGKFQLQGEAHEHLSIADWNDYFVFDKVTVFERDE